MSNAQRFREFVARFASLVEAHGNDERRIFTEGAPLLSALVSHDDWLPEAFAQASAESYRQYLLYCDPLERFSVVSFVWGPGQRTPVHNHTVWGMVGVLRGEELCEEYADPAPGQVMKARGSHRVRPGEVDKVSPTVGDVHVVSNALRDRPSISIHVYGANIGAVRRHVFDPATGAPKPFVSGYHNATLPNFWDRSAEGRAGTGAS
jgi:predicted metal-dependent enzyme (double-stranded beta helix superfamily)